MVLVGAFAFLLSLLGTRLSPDGIPGAAWVSLAGFAFILTREAVVHARDGEPQRAPESTLRLCGVGIGAWILVLLSRFAPRLDLPAPAWLAWCLSLLGFVFANVFTVSLMMLFAVEFGIVAARKARSAVAKCAVAVVHFSAPVGYVLLMR